MARQAGVQIGRGAGGDGGNALLDVAHHFAPIEIGPAPALKMALVGRAAFRRRRFQAHELVVLEHQVAHDFGDRVERQDSLRGLLGDTLARYLVLLSVFHPRRRMRVPGLAVRLVRYLRRLGPVRQEGRRSGLSVMLPAEVAPKHLLLAAFDGAFHPFTLRNPSASRSIAAMNSTPKHHHHGLSGVPIN